MMTVDLGFMTVGDIEVKTGYAEGCAVAAHLFVCTLSSVVRYVLDR